MIKVRLRRFRHRLCTLGVASSPGCPWASGITSSAEKCFQEGPTREHWGFGRQELGT